MDRRWRWRVLVAASGLLLIAGSAAAQRGRGGRPDPRPPAAPPSETPAPGPVAPAPSVVPPGAGKTYDLGFQDVLDAVERGEGREALAFYERVVAEAERQNAQAEAARAHAAVAFAGQRLGAFQKCIRSGLRALELLKAETQNAPTVALEVATSTAVGGCYRSVGDLVQARRSFEEGIATAQGLPPRGIELRVALLQRALASVALKQRDYDTALTSAQGSVAALEDLLSRGTGNVSRMQRAGARTQSFVDTARRHLAQSLSLLGNVHLARRSPADAEAAFAKAVPVARLAGLAAVEAEIQASLGRLALSRNDPDRALGHFQDALTLATRVTQVPLLIAIHGGRAHALGARGRADEALAAARQAIQLVEGLRSDLQQSDLRSGFLEDKQGLYQLAVRFALASGRPEEAFGFAESSRARAFLDLLGNQTSLSKGKTRALVDEEVRLRARLAEARARAEESDETGPARAREAEVAEQAYRAFLERVRKESLEQASLMTVEPVTLRDIQALLPANTSLLEYLVADTGVVVWVIERERFAVVRLPGRREEIVDEVRQLRAAIADQLPADRLEPRARALYDRLFARVRPEVRGEQLLIVPHDALHYLPFAALRTPTGRWLVEDYGLATLPSASVLTYLRDKGTHASDRVLAMGNPDLGPALDLRWAEREARLVGQRHPSATVLVRQQATEAQAKALAPGAGLIHFAMHGELNESDPLSSALLLVPGQGEDGRLEVRELFGLELNARLVVLSACETGLGKLSRGDELVGLQRAFLYAGTPAVVTTLWKVDDRASYELTRAFYERLASAPPAVALRDAQREMIKRYPHPFAWAAFSLTGLVR